MQWHPIGKMAKLEYALGTYKNEKKTTALMHKNFGNGFIDFNSS